MTFPTSTYRLQFRDGTTFDGAVSLIPYLQRLGISHLYASPVFQAVSGSTHGYDMTDPNRLDTALGGRDGFMRMAEALKEAGLGLILDIVPNHMAASLENPWWRDVIEWGHASRHANCFDIDWEQRLTLPFLGKPFEAAVRDGELRLLADHGTGQLVMDYYDQHYPLKPASYAAIFRDSGSDAAMSLVALANQAAADAPEIFHAAARALLAGPGSAEIEEILSKKSADSAFMAQLHDLQSWRLMDWREAHRGLSYRRFFEIAGLVGVRVEDPAVFEAVHRTVFELVDAGLVDGLRVDHVDGLADPAAYLAQLRARIGPDRYLVVEKILGRDEHLPEEWPVQGTTGYEFITAIGGTLADAGGVRRLEKAYRPLAEAGHGQQSLRDAKLLMIRVNFAGETGALVRLATRLCQLDDESREHIRPALEELLVAFPVYRTYGTARHMPAPDCERLERAAEAAAGRLQGKARKALKAMVDLLQTEGGAEPVSTFRQRFQQLTGPLMAKSMEDTLFYRHNAFLAFNEVGGEVWSEDEPPADFHGLMLDRRVREPHALTATATHDTKRGEDSRARLLALSEDPDAFIAGVERWRAAMADRIGGARPKPEVEWMIYQALAGVWPCVTGDIRDEECADIEKRLQAFLEKAAREAKLGSNWSDVNEDYEKTLRDYASHLLSRSNRSFRADFTAFLQPYLKAGMRNALTQTILKLTVPGIPDIYQGSETLDLSFVDPDNRRPPDFEGLSRALDSFDGNGIAFNDAQLADGRVKLHVIATLLDLRRRHPALFSEGSYEPLVIEGQNRRHLLAFLRRQGEASLFVAVPLLTLRLERFGPLDPGEGRTRIILPDDLIGRDFKDLFTGHRIRFPEPDSDVSGFAAAGYSLLLCEGTP